MRSKSSTWMLTTVLALAVGFYVPEVKAQALTQDPVTAGAAVDRQPISPDDAIGDVTSTFNTGRQAINQGDDIIDQFRSLLGRVRGFFVDLPGRLGNIINSALGQYGVPDLETVTTEVEETATSQEEGAALSEVLENRQPGQGSYAIRTDLAKQASRETALEITSAATLSQTAQQDMAQRAQATQEETAQNVQLGEESQSLDVTQQIMQNLSQQTALNSRVNERVLQEAQQARVDRAIANAIHAQQARELSVITTTDRRQQIAAGNAANQQTGLLSLPGGYFLGSEETAELP
jgi:hypothetical protein